MFKSLLFALVLMSSPCWGQLQREIDFLTADVQVEIFPEDRSIAGEIHYKFLATTRTDSVALDARQLEISQVTLNKKQVEFINTGKRLVIYKKLKAGKSYDLLISYRANPEQAVYFLGWDNPADNNKQVWTQGQGKYTSHWLPSIDDMNDKIEFDIQLTFRPGYTVIANGELLEKREIGNKIQWRYNMDKPMSSYLVAFAIGRYLKKKEISASGTIIENYFLPKDSLKTEPTYRFTTKIMDFLTREIGVAYPWKNYKQVPVREFLYAGMENTGLTIFSDQFVVDSLAFEDKNYVNVNAHEMAHQWFGNLVTETNSSHHWLHEGFATYYALRAEEEIFGTEHYSWQLYNKAQMLHSLSDAGEGEALDNPNASSITFYDKGAWAVAILRSRVGPDNFSKGIATFLTQYGYANVTIGQLLDILEGIAGNSLDEFRKNWIQGEEFPYWEAMEFLKGLNPEFGRLEEFQNKINEASIENFWNSGISSFMKCHLIRNYSDQMKLEFRRVILSDPDPKVRQAMVVNTAEIPAELLADYRKLLDDPSYITREFAFFKLWLADPSQRSLLLDHMRGISGMPDKNIETLWLLLASLTEEYAPLESRLKFINRLSDFTTAIYATEVRQRAFSLIEQAGMWTDQNLLDLIISTTHHQWQYRQWTRNLVDRLWKDEQMKTRLIEITKRLKDKDLRYIKTKSSNP